MSESTHDIFWSEFLLYQIHRDDQDLQAKLDRFEEYYNWNRFPVELFGSAPMEVVNGATPNKKRFKEPTQIAKRNRYLNNKKNSYCGTCL